MSSPQQQQHRLHQLPYLFGADIALAALCWMLLFTEHMQITVIAPLSIAIPCMQIWGLTLFLRLVYGMRTGDVFYHRLLPLHLLLILGLLISSDIMLLFCIGQDFLFFSILPLILLLLSGGAHLIRFRNMGNLLLCTALAAICLVPAFQLSGFIHPMQLLRFSPLALLGLLFFLFLRETEITPRLRSSNSRDYVRLYATLMMVGISLMCLHRGVSPTEQFMHYTLLIGVACLHAFSRVLRHVPADEIPSATAPAMVLPTAVAWLILL